MLNVPHFMIEAGVPDFDITTWFGLMAPAGTPKQIDLAHHLREN